MGRIEGQHGKLPIEIVYIHIEKVEVVYVHIEEVLSKAVTAQSPEKNCQN